MRIQNMPKDQLLELIKDYRGFAEKAAQQDMKGSNELFSLVADLAAEVLVLRAQSERDELYRYVNGLLGFLQLVGGRNDINDSIKDVLRTNHRVVDAAAYLTQIVPPQGTDDGLTGRPSH